MEDLATSTITQWFSLLKSTHPVPAAVSLCAVNAAGAISLALKITAILRAKHPQTAEQLTRLLETGHRQVNALLDLAQSDIEAVEQWFRTKDERAKAQMVIIPQQIYQICCDAYDFFTTTLHSSRGSKRLDVQTALNLLKISGLMCKRIAFSNKESH